MTRKLMTLIWILAVSLTLVGTSSAAQTNLVTNGEFKQFTITTRFPTDWTNTDTQV